MDFRTISNIAKADVEWKELFYNSISNINDDEKIQGILNFFGKDNQIHKAKEELQELVEALNEMSIYHIEEEIADVLIMIEQIKAIFMIDNENIKKWQEYKIMRTYRRILELE